MNKPVTRQEMEDFKNDSSARHIGGKKFMGRDNTGQEMYYPNHDERRRQEAEKRTFLKKGTSKKYNNRKSTKGRRTQTLYNTFINKAGNVVKTIKSQIKNYN